MSSNTNSISIDQAEEVIESGTAIAMQEVSRHRWYIKKLVVFFTSVHGLTGFYYLEPATEIQEGQDRFEDDPVPIFPVVSEQVVSTVFSAK